MQSDMPPQIEDRPTSNVSDMPEQGLEPHNADALMNIFHGRLHPMTVAFAFLKAGRNMLPLLPLIIFGGGLFSVGLGAFFIVISLTQALVRYFTFSYGIEGADLVIRKGILERTERHIPLDRVQEIQIEQGVLHRIFGVVDAVIETGGGQGPEASLSVLSRAEVENLRRAVFERVAMATSHRRTDQAKVDSVQERELIRKLSLLDLFGAGLTSNHILSALALVGALWAFLDDLLPEDMYQRIAAMVVGQADALLHQSFQKTIIFALVGLVAVLGISVVFSVIGSIALFYNFTFSRAGEDLHRSYGLLTLRSSSLPRRRIQVLEVEEKFLRRVFGLVTIRADTVSVKEERNDDNKGRDVLLPVIARDEVEGILPVFFPDLADDNSEWHRVSRQAIQRNMFVATLVCALMILALIFYFPGPLAFAPLILLPLIYWISVKSYNSLGYSLGENYFQTRRGWLGRSTHIVPVRKVQGVAIHRNPIDRALGLATLMVDTAGQAYTGGGPQVSNLPVKEAEDVARRLAQRAAATQYKI